jgi:hypothetical protein
VPLVDPAPSPAPSPRPRYQRPKQSFWQRVPVSVYVILLGVLGYAGYLAFTDYVAGRCTITFLPAQGGVVPPLQLTFYPLSDLLVAPSPMRPTGQRQLTDTAVLTVDGELVPGKAVLRYAGAGIGAGATVVQLGRPATVQLAPPRSLRGRAVCWRPSLCLSSLPFAPLAGARVLAMGGGARGVPIGEAVTDADGWFELDGLDADMPSVGLRLCDDGHAIDNFDVPVNVPEVESPELLRQNLLITVPTRPVRGQVILPPDLQPKDLRLVARALPGVDAPLGADGSFSLDLLPPGVQPKLLVYGLPARYTHRETRGVAGEEQLRIEILPATTISGWVLDRNTRQPIGGADVWHGSGPMGMVGTTTAPDGTFTIGEVPAGEVRLSAQHRATVPGGTEQIVRRGHRDLRVEAGVPRKQIIVTVE